MKPGHKRRVVGVLCIAAAAAAFSIHYIGRHPLVFNESFWGHAHCIKQAGASLVLYAHDHGGRFPFHTNGYGDALLLVSEVWLPSFTGPGYDTAVFERARRSGGDVPEGECGRVYVQGLSETNSPDIVLLFDKLPSPGDHRQCLSRLVAPLVREVAMLDGSTLVIPEVEWPAFARRQVELLIAAGMPKDDAEKYYAQTPKR